MLRTRCNGKATTDREPTTDGSGEDAPVARRRRGDGVPGAAPAAPRQLPFRGIEGVADGKRQPGMGWIEARVAADDEGAARHAKDDPHPAAVAGAVMPVRHREAYPAVDEPAEQPTEAGGAPRDQRPQAGRAGHVLNRDVDMSLHGFSSWIVQAPTRRVRAGRRAPTTLQYTPFAR
jgi:hypothetical protein